MSPLELSRALVWKLPAAATNDIVVVEAIISETAQRLPFGGSGKLA